jgi:ATP-dependent Clp protease protease subunit
MSKENKKDTVQSPSVEECGIFLLMDEISDSTCKDVIQFIISKNISKPYPKYLQLIINSGGGDLQASAAIAIFMAGEKGYRVLTPNTSILSHQYSWGTYGKEHELLATVREYELTTKRMINHYKKCTGLTEKKIREFLLPAQDIWLSATEAKKLGICDSVKTVY